MDDGLWIAAVRAEIERDGVHVAVDDDALVWAVLSPLVAQAQRFREARDALDIAAGRAAEAVREFAALVGRIPPCVGEVGRRPSPLRRSPDPRR